MDRFVVGTGRCGSTLLSKMLAEHPSVCSIFECLNGLDVARRFAPDPIDGDTFFALFAAEQPFLRAVLRRGHPVDEVVYPFAHGRYARGRFARSDRVPYVLTTMLARLSDDPDALLAEVEGFARAQPPRPAPAHFRALFGWLAERAGRTAWIERSGSSIEYLPGLGAAFPGARFLHLHREGPETALSMREHHAYRLPVSVLYRAPDARGEAPPDPADLDFDAEPAPGDAISRILAARPDPAIFGRYWSDQLVRGLPARAVLGASAYRELGFEELVARPRDALRAIASFFELDPAPASGWVERAASQVTALPRPRVPDLDPAARAQLVEACRPGAERLASEPAPLL